MTLIGTLHRGLERPSGASRPTLTPEPDKGCEARGGCPRRAEGDGMALAAAAAIADAATAVTGGALRSAGGKLAGRNASGGRATPFPLDPARLGRLG